MFDIRILINTKEKRKAPKMDKAKYKGFALISNATTTIAKTIPIIKWIIKRIKRMSPQLVISN